MAKRLIHEGDYAARGGVVIATSECGNYGEDTLTAWKLADGTVVVEREAKGGAVQCWQIDATDTLRTSSEAWGSGGVAGVEGELVVITQGGKKLTITHFEFSSPWGGASDSDVAMLAEAIATEARCKLDIVPTKYPEYMLRKYESAPPPPPPEPPPPPPQAKPLPDNAELLASITCGDKSDEELRAIRHEGGVWIENAMTGERWQITRDDTLSITPFVNAFGSAEGIWTSLALQVPGQQGKGYSEKIAGCYCWADERKGPDEAAVAEFVAKVVAATGCNVVHRELVWP